MRTLPTTLSAAQQLLPKTLGAYIVSDVTTIQYIANLTALHFEHGHLYLILSHEHVYLITSELMAEQLSSMLSPLIAVSIAKPAVSMIDTLADFLLTTPLASSDNKPVGFDPNKVTVRELATIKSRSSMLRFIEMPNIFSQLRAIKTKTELASIEKAARTTDEATQHALAHLRNGVSEQVLRTHVKQYIYSHNAQLAFEPIVAFGAHASMPHYEITSDEEERPWNGTDPVLIDAGARYMGYNADLTRTYVPKQSDPEILRAHKAVMDAMTKVLSAIGKKERSVARLDQLAKATIEEHGYIPYTHALGHGVGLQVHEQPVLSERYADTQLKTGMVVTIEPAIYVPKRFGIRIEELLTITDSGYTLLSHAPHTLY